MAMKASQIQSHGGTEALKLIAASNGVKKLGPKEGRTKQIGDVRLTWKATGEDTGYATSFYEVFFELYAPTVDVNDPLPPKKEPTEAEGEQYLQLLKNAMKVHMYAPQVNASSGLEVLRELEKRNSNSGAQSA